MTAYLPITHDGDIVGVLVADVSFARVQDIVQGLRLSRSETTLVLAANHRIVAHSSTSALAELPALRDPGLVESLARSAPGIVKGYRDELGRTVVGVYAPVQGLDWAVIIQTPVGEFASEVVALRCRNGTADDSPSMMSKTLWGPLGAQAAPLQRGRYNGAL